MKHITEAIVVIIILTIVVNALLAMVAPMAPYVIVAALLFLVGVFIARRTGYF